MASGTKPTIAQPPSSSPPPPPPPPLYFDEKWKLSKKEGSTSTRSSSSSLTKNSSHRRCSFTRKCARLVKEQRARFYIIRRCVTMLICWREYGDSDS